MTILCLKGFRVYRVSSDQKIRVIWVPVPLLYHTGVVREYAVPFALTEMHHRRVQDLIVLILQDHPVVDILDASHLNIPHSCLLQSGNIILAFSLHDLLELILILVNRAPQLGLSFCKKLFVLVEFG